MLSICSSSGSRFGIMEYSILGFGVEEERLGRSFSMFCALNSQQVQVRCASNVAALASSCHAPV